MYKALIVDDEPRILKGIRKTFNWEENGFEVIGEVSNSVAAYDIICEQKPQVVFTDICMPAMSGVELMKKTREDKIDTEFVIISGYSDFSYAQESIKFGAFGYLLKPLNRKEANELLERLEEQLKKKYCALRREIYDSMSYNEEFRDKLHETGFVCTKKRYLCAMDNKGVFDRLFKRMIPDTEVFSLDIGNGKYFYMINYDTDDPLDMQLNCDDPSYIAGVSSSGCDLSDTGRLLKEARIAFLTNIFLKQKGIRYYCKTCRSEINSLIEQTVNAINAGEAGRLIALTDTVPNVYAGGKLDLDDLCSIYNVIFSHINFKYSNRLNDIGITCLQPEQVLFDFGDMDHFVCFIKEIINLLFDKTKCETEDTVKNDFNGLLNYINDNYCKDITLKDVAEKHFLNYAYVCTLFKKNTGNNFLEYIMDLRMKKAAELIKQGNVKMTEVYNMVGFNDYYYFNKVFKKYYNMTPSQFKNADIGLRGNRNV